MKDADFVVSSLPISAIVESCVDDLIASKSIKEGTVWVDTTSGVPSVSARCHSKLKEAGVKYPIPSRLLPCRLLCAVGPYP